MKKILIAAAISLFLGGCSEDEPNGQSLSASSIELSANAFKVGPDGGTCEVSVTSTGNWRMAGNCDWAVPSAEEGKSGDKVTFTVEANNTDKDREATFKFFTGSSTQTLTISSGWAYVMELVSEPEAAVSSSGGEAKLELDTNVPQEEISYEVEGGNGWVTFKEKKNLFGNTLLVFDVAANSTYKDKDASIRITGHGKQVEAVLRSSKKNVVLTDFEPEPYTLDEQDISFDIRTNVNYTLDLPEWITLVGEDEGETCEEGLTEKTCRLHISQATINRSGQIKFTYEGENLLAIEIQQVDPDAEIIDVPDDMFRSIMVSNGWVMEQEGTKCIVLDAAKAATQVRIWGSEYTGMKNLKGIEALENATSVEVGFVSTLEEFDISGLHKVTKVDLSSISAISLSRMDLGDNAIPYPSFSFPISVPKLTVKGGKNTSVIQFNGAAGTLLTIDISEAQAPEYDIYQQGVTTVLISQKQKDDDVPINVREGIEIKVKE